MADLVDLAQLQCFYESLELFTEAIKGVEALGHVDIGHDSKTLSDGHPNIFSPFIISASAVMAWHSFVFAVNEREIVGGDTEASEAMLRSLSRIRDRWTSVLAHLLTMPPVATGTRWHHEMLSAQELGNSPYLLPTFGLSTTEKGLAMLVATNAIGSATNVSSTTTTRPERCPYLVTCPLTSRMFALKAILELCSVSGGVGDYLKKFRFLVEAIRARVSMERQSSITPLLTSPFHSHSLLRIAAIDLQKAVAESRTLSITETYKIPSSTYDPLTAEKYVTAALTLKKPSSGLTGTLPPAGLNRNLGCGPLGPLISVLKSHRLGSNLPPLPPFLSRDGSKITASFGGLLTLPCPLTSAQPHLIDKDDKRWLEGAYSSVVANLGLFIHQMGERLTSPAIHAMLPVINDTLRVAALLGMDANMLLLTAAVENYSGTGASNMRAQFLKLNELQAQSAVSRTSHSSATDASQGASNIHTVPVAIIDHPVRDLSLKLMLHTSVAYKRVTADIRSAIAKAVDDVYRSEEVMRVVFKKAEELSHALKKAEKKGANKHIVAADTPSIDTPTDANQALDPLLLQVSPYAMGILMNLIHPLVVISAMLPSMMEGAAATAADKSPSALNVGCFLVAYAVKETLVAIDAEMVRQVTNKSGLLASIGTGKWAIVLTADRQSILKYLSNTPLLDQLGDPQLRARLLKM